MENIHGTYQIVYAVYFSRNEYEKNLERIFFHKTIAEDFIKNMKNFDVKAFEHRTKIREENEKSLDEITFNITGNKNWLEDLGDWWEDSDKKKIYDETNQKIEEEYEAKTNHELTFYTEPGKYSIKEQKIYFDYNHKFLVPEDEYISLIHGYEEKEIQEAYGNLMKGSENVGQ